MRQLGAYSCNNSALPKAAFALYIKGHKMKANEEFLRKEDLLEVSQGEKQSILSEEVHS